MERDKSRRRLSGGANVQADPGDNAAQSDRLAAHERLSTGALARWTRICASHPWRIVFGWIGVIVVPIGLVVTIGGSLKDEFTIPGSESQKATDLIESKFASEQGGVLNLVFAAPKGETLDTPDRKQAINAAVAKLKTSEFKPTDDHVGIESVGDPFSADTFSKDRRLAYPEGRFNKAIFARNGAR